ncbi:hypothetical protein RB653_009856 [Dictyostelium firmibasis]|uniref:Uncharacterized protein n=1 Tax=Dictyostelium firmibasis TaxID=79012 RepID=A0AAN7TSV7_9MYCE
MAIIIIPILPIQIVWFVVMNYAKKGTSDSGSDNDNEKINDRNGYETDEHVVSRNTVEIKEIISGHIGTGCEYK